jgi:hypothetical protein
VNDEVGKLATVLNAAGLTPDMFRLGRDLRVPAARILAAQNYERRDAGISAYAAALFGREEEPRVTHGRHCRCTACAREDWTNPNLAPCGMHGPSCPPVYDPR